MNEREAAIYRLRIKSRIENIRDAKTEEDAYEVLVAAADPNRRRLEADARFADYLKLSGKEIADAMEDAMRQAFKEVSWTGDLKEITPGGIVAALVAAAKIPPAPKHCMTPQQKTDLDRYYDEWMGNIEGSLEQVATDTFGNVVAAGSIPVKEVEWGINVPEDAFVTAGFDEALQTATEEALTRPLTSAEQREVTRRVNNYFEVNTQQVSLLKEMLDRDLFEGPADRRAIEAEYKQARARAGLDPVYIPKDVTPADFYQKSPEGDIYWTRANLTATYENDLRQEDIKKFQAENNRLEKVLKKRDQQNLKDYSRLGEVFHWNSGGSRSYLRYVNARYWRDSQGVNSRFRPITFKGIGVTDISSDIATLQSQSKAVGSAEKEIARGRVQRFLEQNVPSPTPAKIRALLDNKQFIGALGNPSIVSTEIRSSGVGVAPLHAGNLRDITDRGVKYARLSRKSIALAFEDEVCKGLRDGLSPQEAFDKALAEQRARLQRIGENVSNNVINDTIEEVTKDPFFSSPEKVWITSFHNSRASHVAAYGQRRPLKVPFTVGGELGMRPHDPSFSAVNLANCQCRMVTLATGEDGKEYQVNFATDIVPTNPETR